MRPGKGRAADQHFLIDDRQTVLIAKGRRLVVEHLGRRIGRRHARDERVLRSRREFLHQAEVGHLDVIAENQQVFRLNVEVQQVVPLRKEVERLGRVGHVSQQFVARNARQGHRRGTVGAAGRGSCRPVRSESPVGR